MPKQLKVGQSQDAIQGVRLHGIGCSEWPNVQIFEDQNFGHPRYVRYSNEVETPWHAELVLTLAYSFLFGGPHTLKVQYLQWFLRHFRFINILRAKFSSLVSTRTSLLFQSSPLSKLCTHCFQVVFLRLVMIYQPLIVKPSTAPYILPN